MTHRAPSVTIAFGVFYSFMLACPVICYAGHVDDNRIHSDLVLDAESSYQTVLDKNGNPFARPTYINGVTIGNCPSGKHFTLCPEHDGPLVTIKPGGRLDFTVEIQGTSHLLMEGGIIDTAFMGIHDHAVFTMTGGRVGDFTGWFGTGPLNMGAIGEASIFFHGGAPPDVSLFNNSTIHFFGSQLLVQEDPNIDLSSLSAISKVVRVSGVFADNEAFSSLVYIGNSESNIILHSIPEPQTSVLALLGLVICGIIVRRSAVGRPWGYVR